MCGIAALFAYGAKAPPVDAGELRAIRDRMEKRGPDGAGEWFSADGRVGLGHRRLSIIDLRAIANQPMEHDGRLQLVFNGEIYNYKELRAELEAKGRRFRTDSDTEVILQIYDAEGAAGIRRLRGMFAIVLYDSLREGVLLARDPLGIKPLYVADDGLTLRIASQVKALLAGGKIPTDPDPAGHAGFFLWGAPPDPYTMYRAIRALPAGVTQWIDHKGARMPQRYWRVGDVFAAARPSHRNAAQQREELRAALLDSLRHHFIADVPVGMFLSAGRDSTTLTALAAEDGAANLTTLTLGFSEFAGSENDEAPLAEIVAKQRRTNHTTRWVKAAEFAADRAALIRAMDQPTIDGVNTYFVAKAAHESGLKVALSGLGGDELFAGYPSFRDVPRVSSALAPLRGLGFIGRLARYVTAPWIGGVTSPKYAGLLEYGPEIAGAYMLRRCLFMPWELDKVMPREMAEDGLAELSTRAHLRDEIDGLDNPRLQVAALELSWYMRNILLRDSDWAGMAHSLEIRTPFVDATLIERLAPLLAGATPPSKADMAAICNEKLPEAIVGRAKTGFMAPVRDWALGETGGKTRGLRGWAQLVYQQQLEAPQFDIGGAAHA